MNFLKKYLNNLKTAIKFIVLENRVNSLIIQLKLNELNHEKFKDLRNFEVKIFSQNGEDGILDYILNRINLYKPNCLELGSGDFSECNTNFLNLYRNSNVYLVDNSYKYKDVYAKFYSRFTQSLIYFDNSKITTENILSIFNQATLKIGNIDLLSIDLDGNDYHVLKKIPLKNIKVVIVEYNPTLSINQPVSTIYDPNFDRTKKHFSFKYYGASLKSFQYFLTKKGFVLLGVTSKGTNAFFIKKTFLSFFSHLNKEIQLNLSSRESRDIYGNLNFLHINDERKLMKDLNVINTKTGIIEKLSRYL